MPLFQRRHYQHVAENVRYVQPIEEREKMIEFFVDLFRRDNSQFKSELFRQVCRGQAPVNARTAR